MHNRTINLDYYVEGYEEYIASISYEKDSLAGMPEPVLLSQCPQTRLDLCGLMQYAQGKGVKVIDLTGDEKAAFIKKIMYLQKPWCNTGAFFVSVSILSLKTHKASRKRRYGILRKKKEKNWRTNYVL